MASGSRYLLIVSFLCVSTQFWIKSFCTFPRLRYFGVRLSRMDLEVNWVEFRLPIHYQIFPQPLLDRLVQAIDQSMSFRMRQRGVSCG